MHGPASSVSAQATRPTLDAGVTQRDNSSTRLGIRLMSAHARGSTVSPHIRNLECGSGGEAQELTDGRCRYWRRDQFVELHRGPRHFRQQQRREDRSERQLDVAGRTNAEHPFFSTIVRFKAGELPLPLACRIGAPGATAARASPTVAGDARVSPLPGSSPIRVVWFEVGQPSHNHAWSSLGSFRALTMRFWRSVLCARSVFGLTVGRRAARDAT